MKQKDRNNIIQLSAEYVQSIVQGRSRDFSQTSKPELMDTKPAAAAATSSDQPEAPNLDLNLLRLYKAIDMAG